MNSMRGSGRRGGVAEGVLGGEGGWGRRRRPNPADSRDRAAFAPSQRRVHVRVHAQQDGPRLETRRSPEPCRQRAARRPGAGQRGLTDSPTTKPRGGVGETRRGGRKAVE